MSKNIVLSVVIPSYKDPYMHNTVDSLLDNSVIGDQLEVIVVLDGYNLEKPMRHDPRIVLVHIGKNSGMRESINTGVHMARGTYLMRTDEHCMFAPGYDKEMIDTCQYNWIMTPMRYALDPKAWKVMDGDPIIYEKLAIQGDKKFSGVAWRERDKRYDYIKIDRTMAMQGSCWFMPHAWWDKVIGKLQTEGYGPHYQDSHEMVFKTWQAGGELMINKNTWYAHKHRSFSRTHQEGTKENPSNREAGWKYSLDLWRDYYESEVRPRWFI